MNERRFHYLRVFRDSKKRHQCKLPNGTYWECHNILNTYPLADKLDEELDEMFCIEFDDEDVTDKGKCSPIKIADCIREWKKRLANKAITGSAEALFQAQQNSLRDNDVEADRVRKQELCGYDEIRAKMTGGRSTANSRQVGGGHYQEQGIQHWDYVIANHIPYMEAQIIKYVSRWRAKNGLQDLEKALHFLEKLIEVSSCSDATTVTPNENEADPAQPA